MSYTHGWTTWDPSSITIWEHLPSGLRCQLVLHDNQGQPLTPTGWEPLEEALPDSAGRSVAHLRVFTDTAEVEVECGSEGDTGACRIAGVLGDNVHAHWEVNGELAGWQVRRGDFDIIFAPEHDVLPEDTAAFISEERAAALRQLPRGEWRLLAPLTAMEAALAANTFTLPETDTVMTASRHDLEQLGHWMLSNWQTFLVALATAPLDPQLAVANCRHALELLSSQGMLGAYRTADGLRDNLSNPPVAAYCVWKIFQLTGDQSLIDDAYPMLLRWHDWWLNARDGNHNRLLNWGGLEETGMPEHPLYATAPIDEQTGELRIDDVGLCALWALDAYALMRMALTLNDLDRATHLETEINEMSSRVNLELWDGRQHLYFDRDWDGFFTDRLSATVFLAFAGSLPTRKRADRLVMHLDQEFDTPFLVPTLGKTDADAARQLPWRGRVSPLLNFLICEGLRQFGYDEQAETISLSSLDLIEESWKHHQLFASYNALSGHGDDIPQDPLAPAGMLLGALGIAMLIDAEPWDGIRLGNLRGIELSVTGLRFRGALYDVASGPWGFAASRDGEPWLDFDKPAIMRNLTQTGNEISCSIKLPGGGPIRLRFHGYQPGETMSVKVNGTAVQAVVDRSGVVDCRIDIDAPHSGHGIWNRAA